MHLTLLIFSLPLTFAFWKSDDRSFGYHTLPKHYREKYERLHFRSLYVSCYEQGWSEWSDWAPRECDGPYDVQTRFQEKGIEAPHCRAYRRYDRRYCIDAEPSLIPCYMQQRNPWYKNLPCDPYA